MATTEKKVVEKSTKEYKDVRVDNRTKASCTIFNNVTQLGGTVVLLPGINEEVPGWIVDEPYFQALKKDGILSVLASDDTTPAVLKYKLDSNGMPIQAVDDKGEPVFDEKTGDPVFVPLDEE